MVKSDGEKICSDMRAPLFYKIVHPDFPTQCLRIPQAFMKHIAKEKSERAILEGPSGNHWHVKLCKTADGTFLQDGWQDFRRDHSLWNDEFLVFRYDGNMHFNVQIFSKSGVEKNDVFTIKTDQGSDFSNGGKQWGRQPKKFASPSGKKRGRPSKKIVSKTGKKRGRPPKQLSQSKACYEDPDVGIELIAQKRIKTEDVGQPIRERSSLPRSCSSRGKPKNEEERAKSFTSNFPYFTRCMNRSNVCSTYVLRIPTDFAKAHFQKTKAEIVLRNLKGKAWIVKFVPGRTCGFCGGWTAFARDNDLNEGDICIFELVGKLEMLVHIFKVSSAS